MMTENARLILGLRAEGWSAEKINDFLIYIATGDETYKPGGKPENQKQED